jgi:hypothetical protein
MPGARRRDEEVDRAEDRARADQDKSHDPEVGPRAVEVRSRQRRVFRPAGRRGTAGDEEAGRHQRATERQQPEREGVDPGERHVWRADLERDGVVPEAREDRDDEQEQHEAGVHREGLVVEGLVDELQPGLRELEPDDHREEPAGREEDERVDQVQDPDLLVIGRRQPFVQAATNGGSGGVQRSGCHPGSCSYWTVMVPVMFGWTMQTKG